MEIQNGKTEKSMLSRDEFSNPSDEAGWDPTVHCPSYVYYFSLSYSATISCMEIVIHVDLMVHLNRP